MNKLLIKELKLGIPAFFYIIPFVLGALMLIPGWLYFLVPLYFCFITIPNAFAGYKSQNDLIFSVMMPVTRKDIVKARVIFVCLLEILHILAAYIYGIINNHLYAKMDFFFLRPTTAFWGLCFVMYGIFNLILISMYYKTAYKYGAPVIVSTAVAIIYGFLVEMLAIKNSDISNILNVSNSQTIIPHLAILAIGIIIFVLLSVISYYIAIKRFERVDI